MASKWAKLRGKYPVRPHGGDEKNFKEKVEMRAAELAAFETAQLIFLFEQADEQKDAKEQELKDLNVEIEALNKQLISRLDDLGLTSIKTQTGRTLYQSVEPQVSVEDRQALEQHVDQNPELHYLWHLNHQSLVSLLKSMLEDGVPDDQFPPGLKIYLREKIGNRKS